MKLSTRVLYGTRALLDLTLQDSKRPIQLKEIAARQDISLHYLEHLIAPLIAAGIIKSTRGARGGIQLIKNPQNVKLSEVTNLLEGSISPAECVTNPERCSRSELCATRDVWTKMKTAMDGVLASTTLQDLAEQQQDKEQAKQIMYYV